MNRRLSGVFFAMQLTLFLLAGRMSGGQETAKDIIARADRLLKAKSSLAEFSMTVVKPDWSRTIEMKAWSLEPDYALLLVTSPARDKGMVTLKRMKDVWNWIPSIQRVIKIPPSMMLQPWMGSDFSNDDLVRESSIVEDYTHVLVSEEPLAGYDCAKIELVPKPEAGVVWGKILVWIAKKGDLELKAEYYDEDGTLIKTMTGSDVRELGGRTIPARWEMEPRDKPGQKTILVYRSIRFNPPFEPSFFSEQNMKRIR